MRILHTNMLRGWGGQSNRILTEALGTRARGHEIIFAIPHGSQLMIKGEAEGIECWPNLNFKPPAQVWKSIPDLRKLVAGIRRSKPDIIHVHGSQDTWLIILAKQILRADCPPVIRTKHNIFPWRRSLANRWVYNEIDAFVAISSFIERQVVEFPGLQNKPRALIKSVPDAGKFSERVESNLREELGLDPDVFLWGSTGRLRPEKGWDLLLPAFKKVREKHPKSYLVIAGDGSLREELDAKAGELGLDASAMRFLGFRKDVPEILSALDSYVLSSRSEGLGTAILEALGMGLPVAAANVGGIPDSVIHEQTGLLFETENPDAIAGAMSRLMEDDALRKTLGTQAAAHVRTEFTEERLSDLTVGFYEEVAERFAR